MRSHTAISSKVCLSSVLAIRVVLSSPAVRTQTAAASPRDLHPSDDEDCVPDSDFDVLDERTRLASSRDGGCVYYSPPGEEATKATGGELPVHEAARGLRREKEAYQARSGEVTPGAASTNPEPVSSDGSPGQGETVDPETPRDSGRRSTYGVPGSSIGRAGRRGESVDAPHVDVTPEQPGQGDVGAEGQGSGRGATSGVKQSRRKRPRRAGRDEKGEEEERDDSVAARSKRARKALPSPVSGESFLQRRQARVLGDENFACATRCLGFP